MPHSSVMGGIHSVEVSNLEQLRDDLIHFWTNTPEAIRKQYQPTAKKDKWEERYCKICAVDRPTISGSHNTDKCLFKG